MFRRQEKRVVAKIEAIVRELEKQSSSHHFCLFCHEGLISPIAVKQSMFRKLRPSYLSFPDKKGRAPFCQYCRKA